jgi:2-polyprenyl-3-methyl-5-hydroxy-6-metoxy-1,4-benzoquinol methylase
MNRETFFNQLADTPEPLAIQPKHEYRLKRLHRRLGDLRGKRVFEPGCGAGPLTARLAEWVGPSGCICALDACAEMVAHCDQAVKEHAHIRTLHGKAETADLPAAAWDLILCFRLYPHLEDAPRFLDRCKQWLAPGGQLVIANLEGSRSLNKMHAHLGPGVQDDIMPSAEALRAQLQADGWMVDEAIDEPEDYFLRARRP